MNRTPLPAAVPVIEVKKIDRILKRDAKNLKLIAGHLAEDQIGQEPTCKSVGRCAIGALLLDAGYPLKPLLEGTANETYPKSIASRLLKREYGLLPAHITAIENTNDAACNRAPEHEQTDRYDAVMGVVSFLDVMQEQGIRFGSEIDAEEAYHRADFGFED